MIGDSKKINRPQTMDFLKLTKIKENTFQGTDLWSPFPGYPIFGGQLAAQSLSAGLNTVKKDSTPNIIHTLFLNPGNPDYPVEYEVENIKDGKTLQMRNVFGRQNGKLIVQTTFTCSLEDKTDKDFESKIELKDDSYLPIKIYILERLTKITKKHEVTDSLLEKQFNLLVENLGVLNNSFDIQIGNFQGNKRQIKISILKNEITRQEFYLFMTLVSDLLIVESALLSLNMNIFSKELYKISSIDHNLYFVGSEIPKTKTIFYVLECVSIRESKANIEGKMCTEDGTLFCITSQQALVRFKK